MAEEQVGSVTVDTQSLEAAFEVPPAQEPQEDAEPASPAREPGTATDDAPQTPEQWQEMIAREKAAREKAERTLIEEKSRRTRIQNEYRELRDRELQGVRSELQAFQQRLDEGDALTKLELDRRDALMRQEFQLQNDRRDQQEHEAKRTEYGTKLQDLAMRDLGLSTEQYAAFLAKHAIEQRNPMTGQLEQIPFGNYNDPEQAFEAAVAFLHYETRDQYVNKVRETATQKADELAKQKLRRALPGGAPTKQQPPSDPQTKYVEDIRAAGQIANPDSWF